MDRMKHRMQTTEGRAFYNRRKSTVETAFGIVKAANGFRTFMLRGLTKVTGEWTLACGAYNLKMLCNLVTLVRPLFCFLFRSSRNAVETVGAWRGGIAPPRSLRTVREPLDSYGSRPPASYSKGCPMGKECGLTSSDAMDPSLCISGTMSETLVLAHDPSR
jgi:hypothetical protein